MKRVLTPVRMALIIFVVIICGVAFFVCTNLWLTDSADSNSKVKDPTAIQSNGMTSIEQSADEVQKLTLNYVSMTMHVGDEVHLYVSEVTPQTASKKVTWSSSKEALASVSSSGWVNAKKSGKLAITATAKTGSTTVHCQIKIIPELQISSSVLVAYFSPADKTQSIAQKLAFATGGELYRIKPAKKYTITDLDHDDTSSRLVTEQNSKTARPSLRGSSVSIASYDVIYIGYPIWLNKAPKLIYTFLESYKIKGKKIVGFGISDSAGAKSAAKANKNLKKAFPSADWIANLYFKGSETQDTVAAQAGGLEF